MKTADAKTFLQSIGKKLHSLRLSQNITPETAAQHLHISVHRLHSIENGEKDYSLDLLICDYYEVSIMEVVEG